MWLKSHHWVDVPHTVYERRRVMNVRESRHTAMLFDKRYYDVETGKYNTDKLPTLYSMSLADLYTNEWHDDHSRHQYLWDRPDIKEAWFVPKDNDFDEDCSREDRIREEREQAAKIVKEKEEEEKRKLEEVKKIIDREKARLKSILNEHVYNAVIAEAEDKAAKINGDKVYLGGPNHGQPVFTKQYVITYSGKRRIS